MRTTTSGTKKEPIQAILALNPEASDYKMNLVSILNWYSSNMDRKDSRQFLQDYVGAEKKRYVQKLSEANFSQARGWISRISALGGKLSEKEISDLNKYCGNLSYFFMENEAELSAEESSETVVVIEKANNIQ